MAAVARRTDVDLTGPVLPPNFEVPAVVHATTRGWGAREDRETILAALAAALGAVVVGQPTPATAAYLAALSACLVAVARAAWPDHVDPRLDAVRRRSARLARAGAESVRAGLARDMRLLRAVARGNAVVAPVYDLAETRALVAGAAVADWVGALRRWAEGKGTEHQGPVLTAWFLVRLVAGAVYAAAAALVNLVYEEARSRVPAVLGYLRAVINKEEIKDKKSEEVSSSIIDTAYVVRGVVHLLIAAATLAHTNAVVWAVVHLAPLHLGAVRRLARKVSGWVCGTTETEHHYCPAEADAEREATAAWRYLWFLMVSAFVADVCLLRVALGARPLAVAFLALCHVAVLGVGKKIQVASEDEGVNDGGGDAAAAMLAASVAKVGAVGVVFNVQLAALSLASLCVTTVLLLISEENLSGLKGSGRGNDGEEVAGFSGNMFTEGAEEEADLIMPELCNARAGDEEEEGSALEEEHGDSSQEEHVEGQRDEKLETSSIDSWDFVEADPSPADQT